MIIDGKHVIEREIDNDERKKEKIECERKK